MRDSIEVRAVGSSIWVRLTGTLDVPCADRLTEALGEIHTDHPVRLDFRELELCHDFALAALLLQAHKLLGGRLSACGLNDSQRRVLAGLGVPGPLLFSEADGDEAMPAV